MLVPGISPSMKAESMLLITCFMGAREPGRGTTHEAGDEDHLSDRQPDHLGGAHVAAQYIGGEAEGGAPHDHVQQQARDDPEGKAPVNARARYFTEHEGLIDAPTGRFENLLEIADRPRHQMVHEGDSDVIEK